MKTLQGFIVNGALYQADTGPEALVGDQVKLYLDTAAIPGLPEYIVGTIQHPIVKVQCGSATSYDIEYDEADLLGELAYLRADDVIDTEIVTAYDVLALEVSTIASDLETVTSDLAAEISAREEADDLSLKASWNLLDLSDTYRARVNLGLGSAARVDVGTGEGDLLPLDMDAELRPPGKLVVENGFRLLAGVVPTTAGSTGVQGDVAVDADYIYICTATNTWKRVAIATW